MLYGFAGRAAGWPEAGREAGREAAPLTGAHQRKQCVAVEGQKKRLILVRFWLGCRAEVCCEAFWCVEEEGRGSGELRRRAKSGWLRMYQMLSGRDGIKRSRQKQEMKTVCCRTP